MGIANKTLLVLLLCGCSAETAVNHMADNIRDELTLIAEDVYSLPPECGEQTKLAQRIELTRERIDIMEEEYISETDGLKKRNRQLKTTNDILSFVLALLAGLLVSRLLRKFS